MTPALRGPVTEALGVPGRARDRVLAVLGSSAALGDHLVAHPDHWRAVTEARPLTVAERTERLVAAVGAPGEAPAVDVLRTAYREQLLGIAALDLTSADPLETLPDTAGALADLAQAALEAALVIARSEVGPDAARTRLAVIAMGKTGGCELNYISDVDVIFVAEPAEGVDEEVSTAVATELASRLMRICSASTAAGSLWQVDPALRPEGKNGPLVRTVASHRAYYERWAKTWEFQALLKARPVAGDPEVGQAYCDAVQPMVWQASSRENFVDDVQAMRRRVEQHIPAAEADRQLKLGAGGLRDVEFSVQLLQLVHGRADESLRTGTTLDGLAALSAGGYVGREDAATLGTAYRLLRTLEHRIQLFRLRRTHLMPTAQGDLRRLGRALGHRSSPAEAVVAQWRTQQREVRRLHERIFYHPLLSAVARLSDSEVRLTPEAARERLSALGFRDPAWSAAAPRGAHRRAEPAGADPAPAAAGDARLVRRRGRPGCRAARLPQDQRRARLDALVPPAAPRRGLRGRAARPHARPQPLRRRPARAGAGVRAVPRGLRGAPAPLPRGRAAPDAVRGRAQGRPRSPRCSPPAPSAGPSCSGSPSPTCRAP